MTKMGTVWTPREMYGRNAMKIYILGNGFDIKHKLPTQYSNFKKYIENKNPALHDQISTAFADTIGVEDIEVMWSNFEMTLGMFNPEFFDNKIDYQVIYDAGTPKHNSYDNLEIQNFFEEADYYVKLKIMFIKWIESINTDSVKIEEYKKFKADDIFLTFNYTTTLQDIYRINENSIFHIHGKVGGSLIIGHDKKYSDFLNHLSINREGVAESIFEDSEDNVYMEQLQEGVARLTDTYYKPIKEELIPEMDEWLSLKEIPNEIEVIGHSFGEIDWEYFKFLKNKYQDIEWKFTPYKEVTEKNLARMLFSWRETK